MLRFLLCVYVNFLVVFFFRSLGKMDTAVFLVDGIVSRPCKTNNQCLSLSEFDPRYNSPNQIWKTKPRSPPPSPHFEMCRAKITKLSSQKKKSASLFSPSSISSGGDGKSSFRPSLVRSVAEPARRESGNTTSHFPSASVAPQRTAVGHCCCCCCDQELLLW